MFQFNMVWPEWVPWLGGRDVFSAIWNFADFCISIGVLLIILRQKAFFKKTTAASEPNPEEYGKERADALKAEDVTPAPSVSE